MEHTYKMSSKNMSNFIKKWTKLPYVQIDDNDIIIIEAAYIADKDKIIIRHNPNNLKEFWLDYSGRCGEKLRDTFEKELKEYYNL